MHTMCIEKNMPDYDRRRLRMMSKEQGGKNDEVAGQREYQSIQYLVLRLKLWKR